jgi:hypothetical protein
MFGFCSADCSITPCANTSMARVNDDFAEGVRRAVSAPSRHIRIGGRDSAGLRANVFVRGNGVETTLLIGKEIAGAQFTTGLNRFPPGAGAPEHFHNCDEQVTILEG